MVTKGDSGDKDDKNYKEARRLYACPRDYITKYKTQRAK